MKGIIKIIILFFILIYANRSIANTVNIIYTVDNSPITNVEINNEITYLKLLSKEMRSMDDKSLVMYASKSIIREKIKEIEILKYFKFGLNDEIVDQNLLNLITSLGINDISEFDNEIKNLSLSKEYIKKKIEIEILWNQIIFNKFKNKLSIDEDKIKKNLKDKLNNVKNEIEEYYL